MSKVEILSKTSKDSSRLSIEENVDPFFPKIRTMDDVIDNFFNQIVQYVIEDMIILEPKEEVPEDKTESAEVIKDYKELQSEDLLNAEISAVSGSRVTLTKRSSTDRKMKRKSTMSQLEAIREETGDKPLSRTSTGSSSEISLDEERQVKIIFFNGNVYEGRISKRIMDGHGKYTWTDGTIYEGDFKDGFPTGKGKMTLPDLSHYDGEFNHGLFHGNGFLNIVSTPTFYSGQWQNGNKHGQGWLLYEPGDWYEGGWANDFKDGFGLRHYKNGAKYRGNWREGKYDGEGIMIWENNDFYKGQWSNGTMHGEGEYIWKAFYNNAFAFPVHNIYKGSWEYGKRSGEGIMHFGDDTGLRLIGNWHKDVKHGDGFLVCGNGRIIDRHSLFQYDKPMEQEPSVWSIKSSKTTRSHRVLEFPIFPGPQYVDVGFYLDKALAKWANGSLDKLKQLRSVEEKCVRHVFVRYLPQLKELYQDYATIAAKTKLCYEPIMIRLFLWLFYKDKEIHKYGLSLADTDNILYSNPKSCVDTRHDPFEPIYFWQFLMSLIGTAFTAICLEEEVSSETATTGVLAALLKKFFEEIIFKKTSDHKNSLLLNYLDLAPIKSVYSLYQKIGEPHSARTFLRESCTKKGESPLLCTLEFFQCKKTKYGTNLVPLDQQVMFEKQCDVENTSCKMRSLYEFRHLGPKNIVRCLAKSCPLIIDENIVVNIDYPLTFLEFYETLLTCIFMTLELEMKREEKILMNSVALVSPRGSGPLTRKLDYKKKLGKEAKNARKKKKKSF